MTSIRRTSNIGINAFLNVINQGMRILFPLITYPYALRILGADGIGKVNYSSSIVSYFTLLAMLGVQTYAVREGAKRRNDKHRLIRFSNEVFTINVLTTVISYIFLLIAVFLVPKFLNYRFLILLQSISIVFTTLGVDWINTIHEDFLIITIRSIITNIITLILLFLFVRTPNDYYIYALLTVITNGIICISNWIYCRRYIHIHLTHNINIKEHIKPLVILFANTIAITIYVNIDITMLGWFKGDYEVGVYSVAVKVYSIVKSMLAAIYTVAIPRLASYIGNKNDILYRQTFSKLWCFLSIILIPSSVGLMCLSPEIMVFMGGDDFYGKQLVLQVLSVALIFAIFGGLITACLNVTLGREKENLMATIIAAGLNFLLNVFMIPVFSQNGAAITTLIAEAFVLFFCIIRIPNFSKYVEKKEIIKELINSIIGSLTIVVLTILIDRYILNNILRIISIILSSLFAYSIVLFILKDKYFFELFSLIKSKIFKSRVRA